MIGTSNMKELTKLEKLNAQLVIKTWQSNRQLLTLIRFNNSRNRTSSLNSYSIKENERVDWNEVGMGGMSKYQFPKTYA